ncbi:hypothetical protein [Pseudoalteromonas sp. 10-33]|uniref:hypothetical protein n=1 Tax=Pseudoalteromonas sp. 10-33 TaxID=1761890 RepID=UPI000AA6872E|nr:hypothetical protein [Pseudoalteromonas sp. 10-33]
MLRYGLFLFLLINSATIKASGMPPYFNEDIDAEYRALLKHAGDILPKSDLPLAYLPLFYPFSFLDIHPTRFKSDKDKQAFANFNLGVLGRNFLNINKAQLSKLPTVTICKKQACKEERLGLIDDFLKVTMNELLKFNQSKDLNLIQQTDMFVYRINNTFFTPAQLVTYYPSKYAGFVPSANYKVFELGENEELMTLSAETKQVRELMNAYNVAAITKNDDKSMSIIFGGVSDNHWGVVVNYSSRMPTQGEYNHMGLEYDIIEKISETRFYFQTN